MSTHAIFVPFDLFGSAGTGAGAQLLADALREMLADGQREKQPSRCHAYRDQVKVSELTFEMPADYESWPARVRPSIETSLQNGEFLLWFGGNHLSVLPVLEHLGAMPGSLVVQFDAHLDVYNLTDCTTELSHGNFLLHAAGPLPPIIHVGHRDLFLPAEHIAKHFQRTISAHHLVLATDVNVRKLHAQTAKAKRVWIDVDCDVLDPAFFPAVTQSLPFGLAPPLLLRLLDAVWSERVVGVSISEFDPARDRNDQSLGTLIWLIEYFLLKRYAKN